MGRQALIVGFVLAAGLGGASTTQAETVEVQGTRVCMGDVLPGAPEPWASLDMGPAPGISQEMRVTREAICARLKQACMAAPPGVSLPRVLRVVRRGQVVTEPRLTQIVRQELIHILPPGSRIEALRLSGGVALPPGQIKVHIALPESLTAGPHTLQVNVHAAARGTHGPDAGDGPEAEAVAVTAYLVLATPARGRRVPVLGRGAEVVVQIRSAGVLVQSSGLAQEAGSIGDIVGVLPTHGSRVLHARVVDAKTVEVGL